MSQTRSRRTLAAHVVDAAPGAAVTVMGHVHRCRELASVAFIVVRDRSGTVQVVLNPDQLPAVGLPPEETVVEISGFVSSNQQAPGGVEITDPTIVVLSDLAITPPVQIWRPSLQTTLPVLLDHASVTWRHPKQRAKWELAAASIRGFRKSLDDQGFTEVQTPKLVDAATESGASVFPVEYFDRSAYLAQSPQFYKQQLVGVFERVYEVGPVFRAEPHATARHLAEYVSLDAELGFITDHRDVVKVIRDVIATMATEMQERAPASWALLGLTPIQVPDVLPVIHFSEGLDLAGGSGDETDLSPEDERYLGHWAKENFQSDFLVVEGYPLSKRPFYTHPQPDDPRWSNSFDLLFRGLELVTGGQRLHRYPEYVAALEARGENPDAYASYLEAFKFGMPPHGGFALGLERWIARIVDAANVREVALFPRDLHRLTP